MLKHPYQDALVFDVRMLTLEDVFTSVEYPNRSSTHQPPILAVLVVSEPKARFRQLKGLRGWISTHHITAPGTFR